MYFGYFKKVALNLEHLYVDPNNPILGEYPQRGNRIILF